MSVDTMEANKDGIAIGLKLGADRERRRIRTAQKKALTTLWELAPQVSAPTQEVGPDKARASITVKLLFDVYYVLESSTRAPRAKRRGRKP